jgi:hypothetical protein
MLGQQDRGIHEAAPAIRGQGIDVLEELGLFEVADQLAEGSSHGLALFGQAKFRMNPWGNAGWSLGWPKGVAGWFLPRDGGEVAGGVGKEHEPKGLVAAGACSRARAWRVSRVWRC